MIKHAFEERDRHLEKIAESDRRNFAPRRCRIRSVSAQIQQRTSFWHGHNERWFAFSFCHFVIPNWPTMYQTITFYARPVQRGMRTFVSQLTGRTKRGVEMADLEQILFDETLKAIRGTPRSELTAQIQQLLDSNLPYDVLSFPIRVLTAALNEDLGAPICENVSRRLQ